jgi:predicted nuclease of predicted toxin-antitoxin system
VRLLLDEMIGPAVREQLAARGLDVQAVVERADLRGASDEQVLDTATAEQRVVVTRNVGDFMLLHRRWHAAGRQHAGLVLVTTHAFPQNRAFVGTFVTALAATADASALPPPGGILFLHAAT